MWVDEFVLEELGTNIVETPPPATTDLKDDEMDAAVSNKDTESSEDTSQAGFSSDNDDKADWAGVNDDE